MRRGLVSRKSIVESDLSVVDASRRNRNFHVVSREGPCYLLKQGIGPSGAATVAHEATVYRFLWPRGEGTALARCLLRCHGYDPETRVLVLESFPEPRSLSEVHARSGRFSTKLAAELGRALAALHCLGIPLGSASEEWPRFTRGPAGVLFIPHPGLGDLREASAAHVELLKVVQRSTELCRHLDELRDSWSPEAFINHDVKWDNCLVPGRPAGGSRVGLKIVDWELAGVGDPCWDVGSVFSAYLSSWLLSFPMAVEGPPERFLDLARFPLERMQPAILSFWLSYVRSRELAAAATEHCLVRSVEYGAARLVQTAVEQVQDSAVLPRTAGALLQLSLNILRKPWESSVQLLGIPWRGAATQLPQEPVQDPVE